MPYKTPQEAVQARIDKFREWLVMGFIAQKHREGALSEDFCIYTVEPSPCATWSHFSVVFLKDGEAVADTALYLAMERAMDVMINSIKDLEGKVPDQMEKLDV